MKISLKTLHISLILLKIYYFKLKGNKFFDDVLTKQKIRNANDLQQLQVILVIVYLYIYFVVKRGMNVGSVVIKNARVAVVGSTSMKKNNILASGVVHWYQPFPVYSRMLPRIFPQSRIFPHLLLFKFPYLVMFKLLSILIYLCLRL